MRPVRAALALAVAAVLAVPAAPAAAVVDVEDFSFDAFSVDYYVVRGPDDVSRMMAVETWVARFPDRDQNRGLVIELPLVEDGIVHDTFVRSVVDETGAEVPWWTEEDDASLYVLTGDDDYVRGVQTYTLTYTMDDVVIDYGDVQEFTWDAVGADRVQSVDTADVRVHVAEPAAGRMLDGAVACYRGPVGSTDTCRAAVARGGGWPTDAEEWADAYGVDTSASTLMTAEVGALGPGEGATVSVGFAPGTFRAPPPPVYPWWSWIPFALAAGASLIGFPLVIGLRARLRRNPDQEPVVVQYTPPADESPTLSAGVLDVPERALAAHVVDLAVRDVVEIRAKGDGGDRDEAEDFELVLREGVDLGHDDRRVLDALFGRSAAPGAVVDLGAFARRPPTRVTTYVRRVDEFARQRGYRAATPGWIRGLRLLLQGIGLVSAIVLLTFSEPISAILDPLGTWGDALFLAAVVLGGLAFVGLPFIPIPATVLTLAGGRHVTYLEGIRRYIALSEAERLRAAQAPDTADLVSAGRRAFGDTPGGDGDRVVNLYERLLPYAVLFGQETRWVDVIREAAPLAAGAARLALFDAVGSRALNDASSSIGRLAATPVSSRSSSFGSSFSSGSSWSSSSSSFGGGFSGGGGGGGSVGGR